MHTYYLKKDIRVFYTTAASFPEGIEDAFCTLMERVPESEKRAVVGFSCVDIEGCISYHAAMIEQYENEGEKYGFSAFIIPSGEYLTETVTNWRSKVASVEHTFRKLARHPNASCPCVELYEGDNMICMVKVNNAL